MAKNCANCCHGCWYSSHAACMRCKAFSEWELRYCDCDPNGDAERKRAEGLTLFEAFDAEENKPVDIDFFMSDMLRRNFDEDPRC